MGEITITEEKLEKLIEQKVDKKLQKQKTKEQKAKKNKENISRRQFLKKTGLGIGTLAALSLTPTTALEQTHPLNQLTINQDLDMTDPDGTHHQIKNAQRVTTKYLETYAIEPIGPNLNIKENLDMQGNNIKNVGNIDGGSGGEFKLCGNNYSEALNMDSAFLEFRKIDRGHSQEISAYLGLTSNIKINRVNTNMGFYEQNSATLHYEDSDGNSQTKTYGNADIDIKRGEDFPSDAYLVKIDFDVGQNYNDGTDQGWGFSAWAEVR